jgi:hypothetical protein
MTIPIEHTPYSMYNSCQTDTLSVKAVPTPIQHIVIAEQLLNDATLPGSIRDRLREQRGAFLFGNTAPDVQVVSGQPREDTHFFLIPFQGTPLPQQAMFERYPMLARARSQPAARAAFIAGYICHLWLDVIWVRDIYLPDFGPEAGWDTMRDRLLYHNILRAWCDRRDQNRLNGDVGLSLATVQPHDWLPFTADGYLAKWRDVLAEQFRPGANIRTVEVFAQRNRVLPELFHHVLDSPPELDAHIFAHTPYEKIDSFYQNGHDQMAELIVDYFRSA